MLPTDLRQYQDRSGWNLLSTDEAGEWLALLVIGLIAAEAAYRLIKWMFA